VNSLKQLKGNYIMLNPILIVTVSLASIAGITTYFVKRHTKNNALKMAETKARNAEEIRKLEELIAKEAEHRKQMVENPEYAEVYNKARVAAAEMEVRAEAARAESAIIRERAYNTPEAIAQRERERLLKLEEDLIRQRSRERDRENDRLERAYRFSASSCNCSCGC
jgi:hypothetical protein